MPIALFVIGIMVLGGATATLLSVYVTVQSEANVEQSVTLEGGDTTAEFSFSPVQAGNRVVDVYNLENTADVDAQAKWIDSYKFNNQAWSGEEDGIDTRYYELELLEDEQTQEQTWGDGLNDLSDPLEVKVSYQGENVVFQAWASDDYSDKAMLTFTLDKDNNGEADFQIQRQSDGWKYKEVIDESWEDEWSDVPGDFYVKKNGVKHTLKVPVEMLGGFGSYYRFGVDSNDQDDGNGQTFYPGPEKLWHDGEDYVSSDHYKEMNLGNEVEDGTAFTVGAGEIVPFAVVNEFAINLEPGDYKVKAEVNPVTD
ncbi:MAG: hypothetical protein ACOCZ6_01720, partial [Nanoarchaeota archaeon]